MTSKREIRKMLDSELMAALLSHASEKIAGGREHRRWVTVGDIIELWSDRLGYPSTAQLRAALRRLEKAKDARSQSAPHARLYTAISIADMVAEDEYREACRAHQGALEYFAGLMGRKDFWGGLGEVTRLSIAVEKAYGATSVRFIAEGLLRIRDTEAEQARTLEVMYRRGL